VPARARLARREVYGVAEVSERHRHRYEVSNAYRDLFVEHGCGSAALARRSARRDDRAAEPSVVRRLPVPPELQSRPTRPHPLFAGFIARRGIGEARAVTTRRTSL
jgi:CTP synthase